MSLSNFKKVRNRLWLWLWFVGFLWLLAVLAYPVGYLNLPMLGVISVGCFFTAFWINNKLVAMSSTRIKGQCPHCQYDLQGIKSDTCPECGTEI